MEEVIDDEVASPVDDACIRNKEEVLSGSSNEMVTPGVDDDSEIDGDDEKDLDRIGSSVHASASPRCGGDDTVKELTLRNYDGENSTIVGSSDGLESTHSRQNQWQGLYQLADGSRSSHAHGQAGYKGHGKATSIARDDNFFAELIGNAQPQQRNFSDNITGMSGDDAKFISGDVLHLSGGARKKVLSKTRTPEYFMKSTLTEKGMVHRSQGGRGSLTESGDCYHYIESGNSDPTMMPSSLTAKPVVCGADNVTHPASRSSLSASHGISLREWLEASGQKAEKAVKMHIFKQILDLVHVFHSRGVPLQTLRPSCLMLYGSYQIRQLGPSLLAGAMENFTGRDVSQSSHNRNSKRPVQSSVHDSDNHSLKKMKFSKGGINQWSQFPSRFGTQYASANISHMELKNVSSEEMNAAIDMKNHTMPNALQIHQSTLNAMSELRWYASPEMPSEKNCTFASNIYCLGVLLFELLGDFGSGISRAGAMRDLCLRILPPSFLSENPKEAGFCLWLLHPEPSLRPTTREIMQSDFMNGVQEKKGGDLLSFSGEELEESDLLLYFLLSLNEQKQKHALNLLEQIHCIDGDIQEVVTRQSKNSPVVAPLPMLSQVSCNANHLSNSSGSNCSETRLMDNIKQLESVYFSMRSSIKNADTSFCENRDEDLLRSSENWRTLEEEQNCTEDPVGSFFDGLCKYARYSDFKVCGFLQNSEYNNSANVICSLNFDRDEDFLAAGGVSKKIKIFEFQSLINDSVGVHYPVVEMPNKSKLSCVCWNNYIRNYLSSTHYDGSVKLWDVACGQEVFTFTEHAQRAWSVDFSHFDPTRLASGSDDRFVKLWGLNDKNSVSTIRANANVCCVQFSAHSSHLLAFSSADYKTYCYDLRNTAIPWCTLAGHEKAVSYVRFLDSSTIVTASTDNTLKIWDLKKTSLDSVSRDACVLTLKGHTNEKNFVGLSVADGYITCGSETNEVYAYHRTLPMPITSHRFGSTDPITGKETEDSYGQFVSSVCWRKKSSSVVAANSSGCIKLLQLV